MAQFLETNGTSAAITKMIRNAKTRLVLITPYVQFAQPVLERIEEAATRGVQVSIVFGKEYPGPRILEQVKSIPNLSVYYLLNLHAKCYYNDENMVLTSMNLYKFSAENNREMGVWIDRAKDAELFQDALKEAESIINRAEKISLQPSVPFKKIFIEPSRPIKKFHFEAAFPKLASIPAEAATGTHAHCIRCASALPQNPDYPLCTDCYTSWAKYKNDAFTEKYCHTCGEEHPTTYSAPLCKPCYLKMGRK